jgi:4-amino-4-deoxy-L-arabinose transferase-like glycosyltransferase
VAVAFIVLRITCHVSRVTCHASPLKIWLAKMLTVIGMLILLIAPTVWAVIPVWYAGDSGLPFAGPELLTRPGRPENELLGNQQLVTYLLTNRQGEEFLAATLNATTAAPIILTTGEPVMALGGFSGGDRILSADELAGLVAEDTVRFFLLPSRNGRQSDLTDWVTTHCPVVPAELWQATPEDFNGPPQAGPAGSLQLFDCSGGTL